MMLFLYILLGALIFLFGFVWGSVIGMHKQRQNDLEEFRRSPSDDDIKFGGF